MVIFHTYVKLPEGSPLCYLCYLFNLFLALASGIPAYGSRLEVRQQDSLQYTAWKTLNNCYKGHIIKRHSHRMPRCFYTPPLMVVSFLFLSCMSGHLTKLSPARNTPPVPTEGTDASSRRCRYLVSVWVPLGNQAAPLIPGMGPVWVKIVVPRKGSIFHQFLHSTLLEAMPPACKAALPKIPQIAPKTPLWKSDALLEICKIVRIVNRC